MEVTPALRGEGFYIGEQFGFRYFPTPNNFPTEKAPVLILHGFPGWNTKNEDIAMNLALHGYGSYLVHMKGLGESNGKFSFESVVDETRKIAEFICKVHGVEKLAIVGHSFGGFLALSLKDIASSLVLLSPLSCLDRKDKIDLIANEFYEKTEGKTVYDSSEELKKGFVELSQHYSFDDLNSGLTDIKTLLIHGTKDERIPVEASRALRQHLGATSSYVELEDNHRFTETRKDFPKLVREFFA
jgi:pimeloyl-ACP methyl ester carboxylesterase